MSRELIYPKLPGRDLWLCRVQGHGLANCLFVYAQAIVLARQTGARIVTPTWLNFSLGPYLRHQSDKRHYNGLFERHEEVGGFHKVFSLLFCRKHLMVVEGFSSYFSEMLGDSEYISRYLESHINSSVLSEVTTYDFTRCVAVHVRLGDYSETVRIPISWYKKKIEEKSLQGRFRFLIFSDGTTEELSELLEMENTQRVYFGNALADLFAISKCSYLIGSDSTFSGWGAYLGQVPCVFYRKHFGPVLADTSKEIVESSENLWLD